MIGEDTLLRFGGVALGEACTIVIRGATQQILDEAERSLHDALCVLTATVKEPRIVYGGGKVLIPLSRFVIRLRC
jgi:T-complex protein 1 subunit beta